MLDAAHTICLGYVIHYENTVTDFLSVSLTSHIVLTTAFCARNPHSFFLSTTEPYFPTELLISHSACKQFCYPWPFIDGGSPNSIDNPAKSQQPHILHYLLHHLDIYTHLLSPLYCMNLFLLHCLSNMSFTCTASKIRCKLCHHSLYF